MLEPKANQSICILGVPVSVVTKHQAIDRIIAWCLTRQSRYVCACDVHSLMRAQDEPSHRLALENADMVTPDGQPLVWIGKLRRVADMERVCGPDLLPALCERSVNHGIRHYFYGGADGVAQRLAASLQARFPGLQVAGFECPPFRALSEPELDETAARLKASGAHIVWIGLGCPKQERWMMENRHRLEGMVLIGIGAAFDFHTGRMTRAPAWMQRYGLEWAHRLASEPRRLWRRYLVLAPRFIVMSLGETLNLALRQAGRFVLAREGSSLRLW